MIKNIEDLKNIQIVCRNKEQVKDCLNYFKQLGFDVEDFTEYYDECHIVFWGYRNEEFLFNDRFKSDLSIEFYNKKLVKTLQKFIKEKQEKEKQKLPDFEVAEDGRIIKINNYSSEQVIYVACDYNHIREGYEIFNLNSTFLDFALKYGLAYATREARDKVMFKLEIETKLKNIAERLNAGRKIDWEDMNQQKFYIHYNYDKEILDVYVGFYRKNQGAIFCLDENFLKVAKQEIGEENLIKYFTE